MEERIINLEIKFAHQDEYLVELNKVVLEQQKIIARLEQDVLQLKQLNAGAVDGQRTLQDDKPPHF